MVSITEIAAKKIKEVLRDQNKENAFLRLFIAGQGCSGPSFGMTLEESKTDDDILDEEYGVSLLTDKKLSVYLEGATVDYVESEYGKGFEIRTPQAACGGGCGGCSGC
jgi:iron-sulfur cluster assembly protein